MDQNKLAGASATHMGRGSTVQDVRNWVPGRIEGAGGWREVICVGQMVLGAYKHVSPHTEI